MAVSVVIADARAHSSLLAAILIECGPRGDGYIGKGPVMVVAVQNAGRAVAGDVDIGPAVFIEIESRYAKRVVPVSLVDVSLGAQVLKTSVSAIVVEDVLRARQS